MKSVLSRMPGGIWVMQIDEGHDADVWYAWVVGNGDSKDGEFVLAAELVGPFITFLKSKGYSQVRTPLDSLVRSFAHDSELKRRKAERGLEKKRQFEQDAIDAKDLFDLRDDEIEMCRALDISPLRYGARKADPS